VLKCGHLIRQCKNFSLLNIIYDVYADDKVCSSVVYSKFYHAIAGHLYFAICVFFMYKYWTIVATAFSAVLPCFSFFVFSVCLFSLAFFYLCGEINMYPRMHGNAKHDGHSLDGSKL